MILLLGANQQAWTALTAPTTLQGSFQWGVPPVAAYWQGRPCQTAGSSFNYARLQHYRGNAAALRRGNCSMVKLPAAAAARRSPTLPPDSTAPSEFPADLLSGQPTQTSSCWSGSPAPVLTGVGFGLGAAAAAAEVSPGAVLASPASAQGFPIASPGILGPQQVLGQPWSALTGQQQQQQKELDSGNAWLGAGASMWGAHTAAAPCSAPCFPHATAAAATSSTGVQGSSHSAATHILAKLQALASNSGAQTASAGDSTAQAARQPLIGPAQAP